MSGTTNSIELLKSFAEAGAALEQLPKVQADLEAAHSLIDETNAKLHSEQDNSTRLRAEMEHVRAELAQREADLAQAMFRHNEAQKVIDSIRGALPSVAAVADHSADASVTNSAPATTRGQDQGQGQSDADPTPTVTRTESPTSEAGHTESTSGSQTEAMPSQPNPGEATHNTSGNPSDAPTQSTEKTGPTAPESSANTNAGSSGSDEPKSDRRQYEGSGYWAKPADMTWNDFASKGGLVPGWVHDQSGV